MRSCRFAVAMLCAALALVVAQHANAQRLVWLDAKYGAPMLREQALDMSGYTAFALVPGTLPEACALDPITGQFFYADAAWLGAAIHRTNGGLTDSRTIITGLQSVLGLAVNAGNRRLYWTTTSGPAGPAIESANLDGSGVALLATLPITATPRGIAVDSLRGRLYVADFARDLILGCNLDGSSLATVLVLPAGSRPWGIAMDPSTNMLYWCAYAGGTVQRYPASGGPVTTLQSGLSNPADIALDPRVGRVYWAEAGPGAQRIRSASITGGAAAIFTTSLAAYGGLAIDDSRGTGVSPAEPPVTAITLGAARPTPAAGPVSFELALPTRLRVTLVVSDVQGRDVATLRDGEAGPGRQLVTWDAGKHAAPGVYFVRLRVGGAQWTRRIVLTR